MTFATMSVYRSINYTQWGLRVKVLVVAALIYVVWEFEQLVHGVFDLVFAPLWFALTERNGRSAMFVVVDDVTQTTAVYMNGIFVRSSIITRHYLA
jgi:hypothetical protein